MNIANKLLHIAILALYSKIIAQQAVAAETVLNMSGYIKADVLMSNFSDGEIPNKDPARDFYFPSKTPVSPNFGKGVPTLDMHAKQSRFAFGTETTYEDGQILKTFAEVDFMLPSKGNENTMNAYEPALRHAFASYGQYLIGQTWSNFTDIAASPDVLDFAGPTESSALVRQPQVRIRKADWLFSLENPETTLIKAIDSTSQSTGDALFPDVTIKHIHKLQNNGHLAIALLGRQLLTNDTQVRKTAAGFGLNLSGKIVFKENDNVRFSMNTGKGVGRYIGLNLVDDAIINQKGELSPIEIASFFMAYQHYWLPKWRSTLVLSHFISDYPREISEYQSTVIVKKSKSASANLIYTLHSTIELGTEVRYAELEKTNGHNGSLARLQFSAKYIF